MDEMENIGDALTQFVDIARDWLVSPQFYAQLGIVLAAIFLAMMVSRFIRPRLLAFGAGPVGDAQRRPTMPTTAVGNVLFPIVLVIVLGLAIGLAESNVEQSGLIRLAQGLAAVFLVFSISNQISANTVVKWFAKWVALPITALYVFGWLDDVVQYLDSVTIPLGDIELSAYAIARTLLFGVILFWFGRLSNNIGKDAIRRQQALDVGTREVFAKLFEIVLFVVVFLLLLQVMGINLTALAVFGGALGVGLGFGLQQIAANFISGIIILLDRAVGIGDFIELEDGRSGTLRELNMRFGVIETFDGKDIMVPNEQFITSSYTNWTHKNKEQRYSLEFQVAYSTDLDLLFDNIREICAAHPKVISGDDVPIELRPDAEIASFGDSGINILVEFWMQGVDDGENRVGADLLHSIWRSIQEHGMQIPFPQREVRILDGNLGG